MTSIAHRHGARGLLRAVGLLVATSATWSAAVSGQEFLPSAERSSPAGSDVLTFAVSETQDEGSCPGGVCTLPTDPASTGLASSASPVDPVFGDTTPVADPLKQALTPPPPSAAAKRPMLSWQQMTRDPLTTALLSLGLVATTYFLIRLFWQTRRATTATRSSGQVIEIVGQIPLGPRHQLQLVKLATRLVLVSVTPQGAETLAEITDPVEVEQILDACQTGGSTLAGALDRLSRRHAGRGRDAGRAQRTSPRAVFEA